MKIENPVYLRLVNVLLLILALPVSASAPTQIAKLTASDAAAEDFFGTYVAVDGNTAVVGAVGDDNPGNFVGSAYVFVRAGTTWREEAKLTASDGGSGDWFGRSLDVVGDTAVVSAYFDDDAGSSSGSAYVFTRSGTMWTEEAKLTASDAARGDLFGVSVSVDGDTSVVGANEDDDAGGSSGSAYVFTRAGTTWTEEAKLTASDAAGGDNFGISVAIDGNTIVVGAYSDINAGIRGGSVYVFTRTGATWTEQAKLTATDAAAPRVPPLLAPCA